HIATRTSRTAKADLIPGCRMRVIQAYDVVQHTLFEKALSRQIVPGALAHGAMLHGFEDLVLLERTEIVKTPPVPILRFSIERGEAAPPGFAHRRQFGIAITVAAVLVQFVIQHRRKGYRAQAARCDRRQNEPPGLP